MPRRNALLRLRKTLRARSAELSKRLAGDSANQYDFEAADATGDSADAAFKRESGEMSGQLQDLEARELGQIELALARLQQGFYGICENCQKPIPLARLKALPYATVCIKCERNRETSADGRHQPGADNWAQVVDAEAAIADRPVDLANMEMNAAASTRN